MTADLNPPSDAPVLGVDLGTSAVKCVVVSGGRILGSASAPLDVDSPHPGWSEQPPEAWIAAAVHAIQAACAASGIDSQHVCGIGLSGQMHGAVVLDAQAQPLRPAILWNDNRSTAECRALATQCPEVGQLAGVAPLPGFTAPKLIWMQQHEPELFSRISTILLPKDYLALWLTGERATDRSDAAGTLWLDQKARDWSDRMVEASGIDRGWLPPLKDGFEAVGPLRAAAAEALGLRAGVTVFAGGGDAATGAVALGAVAPGRCMMSLGTSGQLLVVDDFYAPNPDKVVHAFCHTVPNTWFRMAAMLNGARPMAWFANVLGLSVEQMLAKADQANMSRIPLFLPYLTGERSPHGDPAIRGGFYGLEDATGAPEMARAVVEAVAFTMVDALDSFGTDVDLAAPIPVIGGGSRSDIVLQTLADGLHIPVARATAGEGGAALGAALLAKVGTGQRAAQDLAFTPELGRVYTPSDVPGLSDRRHRFAELYQTLRPYAAVG